MSFGLLNLGTQSLQANQTALSVTGQNISNVNTEGYTRQRPLFLSRPELGGVVVGDVDRLADDFLNRQIWTDSATLNSYSIIRDFSNEIDNLMAGDATSISRAMDDYFGALQTAVDDPVSLPNRELFIAQTDAIVQRFNDLDAQIRRQNDTINGKLESNLSSVNVIAGQIAQLNDDIRIARAAGNDSSELYDQRDAKLEELSEYIGFTTIDDKNTGEVSVFVGNGEPLVVGQSANRLTTILSPADSSQLNVAIQIGNSVGDITNQVSGGSIGGMIDYRESTLNRSLDELGRIALVFADSMNQQHQKGMDLDGNKGEPLFTDINSSQAVSSRVLSQRDNIATVSAGVTIDEPGDLQASEYELIVGTNDQFTLIRHSDGKRWTPVDFNRSEPAPANAAEVDTDGEFFLDSSNGDLTVKVDGFTLNINSNTTLVSGDKYLIRPTRNAAAEIDSLLTNARQLALAAPLATSTDASNKGTGTIEVEITDKDYDLLSGVSNTPSPPPFSGLVVQDNPATPLSFSVTDASRVNNASYPLSVEHVAPGTGTYTVRDSTGAVLFGPAVPAPTATEIDLSSSIGLQLTVGGTGTAVGITEIQHDSTTVSENSLTPPLAVSFFSRLEGSANTGNKLVSLPADLNVNAGTSGLTFAADAVKTTDAEEVGSVEYPLTFTSLGGGNYQVSNATGNLFVTTLTAGTPGSFDMTAQIGLNIEATGAAGAAGTSFTVGPADANKVEHSPIFTAQTGSPSATGSIEARVTDTSKVSGAQYPLTVTFNNTPAGNYSVTDSSGAEIFSGPVDADNNLKLGNLGLDIHVASAPAIGDTVTIQPQQNTNGNLNAAVTNVRITDDRLTGGVTFPVGVTYDAGSSSYIVTDSSNPSSVLFQGAASAGTLDLSKTYGFAIDVNNPPEVPADGDSFIIQHDPDSDDAAYVVLTDADGERVLKEYVPGEAIQLSGYQVTVSNQPQVGDSFSVTLNTGGVSDNRNSLLMSDLQFAKTIEGASYQDKYGQVVERIGTDAAVAQLNVQSGKAVLDANKEMRSSISGVNLDEEAAKLVQYQQAYQASAQLIQTAQTIFDTLLQSV